MTEGQAFFASLACRMAQKRPAAAAKLPVVPIAVNTGLWKAGDPSIFAAARAFRSP
jgi:hypothetical protein